MQDDQKRLERARMPRPGTLLAAELTRRYPHDDWLAALAKGAIMNRGDLERILASDDIVPTVISDAAAEIEIMLQPPDPQSSDDVFEAKTNDADAPIEVDAEAGLNSLPSSKPHPSRSDSPNEMGVRKEDRQNNSV